MGATFLRSLKVARQPDCSVLGMFCGMLHQNESESLSTITTHGVGTLGTLKHIL